MERWILLLIAVFLVIIVIVIFFIVYWRDRAIALTPILRVTPNTPMPPIMPPTSNVPVVDVSDGTCCNKFHSRNDGSKNKYDSSESSCSSHSRNDKSESRNSSTSDSTRTITSSSSENDNSDSNSDSSSYISHDVVRKYKNVLENTTNLFSAEDTFSLGANSSDVSSTRSDTRGLDKTLQAIDIQGNARIIQISEITAPITGMQHSGKYLYIYITGRGIYRIAEDGTVKCFAATGGNKENSKYKLSEADRNAETLILSFTIHEEDMYIVTEARNYKLMKKGFVITKEIPTCFCAAIADEKIITYDRNGNLCSGKKKLADSLSESLHVAAGMRIANDYLYYVTKTKKLVRSKLDNDRVFEGEVLAKNVKAFDARAGNYAYVTGDNSIHLLRGGYEIPCDELDLGNEIRLCLTEENLYVSSW